MRVHICAVGRLRAGPERELLQDYLTRFDRTGRPLGLGPVAQIEVEDKKNMGMAAEGALLERAIPSGALMVAIATVGILYHALLANQFPTEGLGWWADLGLHTVMPAGFAAWWLAFAPKAVRWSDVPHWLVWPAAYAAYALIRGSMTGFWPYGFLDADTLGWPHLARNLGALLVALLLLSLAVAALARILHSDKPT